MLTKEDLDFFKNSVLMCIKESEDRQFKMMQQLRDDFALQAKDYGQEVVRHVQKADNRAIDLNGVLVDQIASSTKILAAATIFANTHFNAQESADKVKFIIKKVRTSC